MSQERIEKLADALLTCAMDEQKLVRTWNCGRARSYLSPKAEHSEVLVAKDLLLELQLITATSEPDSYRLTASGMEQVGRVGAYRRELRERADAEHAANLATVDAVKVSKEQAAIAAAEASNARTAMWWSIGAAIASAVIALLSWLFPRH